MKFKKLVNWSISGQSTYGKGIGNNITGLKKTPISFIPRNDKPGYMEATPMMGWFAATQLLIGSQFTMNAMFGEARVWDSGVYYKDLKYALDARINLFYRATHYFQCGIEYLWEQHATYDVGKAGINRLQASIIFSL